MKETESTNLPIVFERNGVVFASSRDVAAYFGKRHDHVLRDIDQAIENLSSPDLGSQWFRATEAFDAGANRIVRSYDMTRDGFAMLVMGYTGSKAMAFKVAYIQRFNEMEAALKSANGDHILDFFDRMKELRLIQLEQAQKLEQVDQRMDFLEGMARAAQAGLTHDTGLVTILGYCKRIHKIVTTNEAAALGRKAARMCSQRGIEVKRITDERYGAVNVYPVGLLEELMGDCAGEA